MKLSGPDQTRDSDIAVSEKLAALSHPARMEILRYLACREGCCCKDVVGEMDLAQSTVSQHLKVLVGAGLVKMHAEHPRSLYAVDREAMKALAMDVAQLIGSCCTAPARHGTR